MSALAREVGLDQQRGVLSRLLRPNRDEAPPRLRLLYAGYLTALAHDLTGFTLHGLQTMRWVMDIATQAGLPEPRQLGGLLDVVAYLDRYGGEVARRRSGRGRAQPHRPRQHPCAVLGPRAG